ncbi:S-adenosyl-L-methionine-dependent methyltransferase, partial [Peniophora sp. CONT]
DRDSSGWSANAYNSAAHFVYSAKNTANVLGLLDAQPGERIVDFGCGSGEVTIELVKAVGEKGHVAATDISSSMIEKAAKNTGLPSSHLIVGDLQDPTLIDRFPSEFIGHTDKVFTTATLHWCKRDPKAVLEGAARLLRPGGIVVGEMGGAKNIDTVRSALHSALKKRNIDPSPRDPWYFPSDSEYSEVIQAAGLKPLSVSLHPRPTPAHSVPDWIRTFAGHNLLEGLSEEDEKAIVEEATEEVQSKLTKDEEGKWPLDYVRLRFVAVKE